MSTTVSYKGQNIATVSNNTKTLETEGKYLEADIILMDDSEPTISSLTVTPTTSQQTFNSSSVDGYKPVVVNAMPSGTAGTPTATKGTVSNHSVSVTPSVTNTTGYINGGTKTGTAVTVRASELVSGSQALSDNGTYDVTNLAEVVVNVSGGGGGASNFVQGTFTTNSSSGVQSVSIPYTGSGYPIMAVVVVSGGAYASGTDWYSTVQRYAVGQWTLTKSDMDTTPTWTTSGAANQGVTTAVYKNSTSTSTSYTRTSGMNINIYSSSNANTTATSVVRFRSPTTMSIYVAASSYGLLADTKYDYFIVYSS